MVGVRGRGGSAMGPDLLMAQKADGMRNSLRRHAPCQRRPPSSTVSGLGNIRPRPAPLVKERTTMEGRTEALTSKAIVGLKACTRREDDL